MNLVSLRQGLRTVGQIAAL